MEADRTTLTAGGVAQQAAGAGAGGASAGGAAPDAIAARIAAARTFRGVPFERAPLPFESVRDLGRARSTQLARETVLVAYDETGRRTELDYAGFWARARGLGAWLRSSLGVDRGDRVATFAHNSLEAALATFAVLDAGLVLVPCNMTEDVERLGFVLRNAGVRAVLALAPYLERAAAACREAGLPPPAALSGPAAEGGARVPDPERLAAGGRDGAAGADDAPLRRDDEALVVYTSGTTGAPKGVVLAHGNLLADAAGIAAWHRLGPGDRMMCVLPIHHVNGLVVTLVTPQVFGGAVVLNDRFRTELFWRRIAAERVAVVSVVPTLLAFLLERPELADAEDLSVFRHVVCGAGPLTVELAARFEDRFRVPIVHGYGLSETTCYSSFLPVELPAAEHRSWLRDHGFPSIGVAVPPNEMAIHDPQGRELPDGARGEIVVRGHNVMKGYHARPDANAETFAHGWFRSGDEGFRRDGHYFITGRLKELIIRGGVNLSPLEIDEVLNRIPGVAAGLAVGFANDWYGEEVGAYVKRVPGEPISAETVLRACAERLPFPKRPKVVVFGDAVPVTSTGKYQRRRLLELFEPWRAVQFREGADGLPAAAGHRGAGAAP
ncbi:MAG TPA: class I adenylate-forming enzyme family protein [Gemmatimonadota bacterium]